MGEDTKNTAEGFERLLRFSYTLKENSQYTLD
jgi:hypothetical protein